MAKKPRGLVRSKIATTSYQFKPIYDGTYYYAKAWHLNGMVNGPIIYAAKHIPEWAHSIMRVLDIAYDPATGKAFVPYLGKRIGNTYSIFREGEEGNT